MFSVSHTQAIKPDFEQTAFSVYHYLLYDVFAFCFAINNEKVNTTDVI